MTPKSSPARLLLTANLLLSLLACGSSAPSRTNTDAAASDANVTGTGGFIGTGGVPGSGGIGTGGMVGSGGAPGSGGIGTGGMVGSGGVGTGGMVGSGGTPGSGGVGTGGMVGSGGTPGSGGTAAFGGTSGPGGTPGSGGTPATGGGGGLLGSGGTAGNGGSTNAGGKGSGGTTGAGGEYGFTYRSPGSHTVSCTGSTGTMTNDAPDMDWLCTFGQANQKGYVYIRATATSAQCLGMGAVPIYTTELAQISIDGVVTALANAQYNYGGNHNNDYVTFDYQNASYKYYHSSFGFGWRACQPMDCISIYAVGSTTPTTDGCTAARALPEICVPIEAAGTPAPLVDTFKKCPGDSG